MSNTNTLPPELEEQIDAEATNKTMKLPANNSFDVGYMQGMENGYIAGATEYASKIHLLQQEYDKLKGENERLEAWKKSQMELTLPIIDWGQHNSALLPGDSIFQKVLEYATEYEKLLPEHAALKEKADKMADALRNITPYLSAPGTNGNHWLPEVDAALSSYNSTNNQNENNG